MGAARGQSAVHRLPEELHGEILERQRRAMEKFEHEKIVAELHERRARGVAEVAIGGLSHLAQCAFVEIGRGEGGHDAGGGLFIGQAREGGDRRRRPARPIP